MPTETALTPGFNPVTVTYVLFPEIVVMVRTEESAFAYTKPCEFVGEFNVCPTSSSLLYSRVAGVAV